MKTTLAVLCSTLLGAQLAAQCTNSWTPFGPSPGTGLAVFASIAWDPDGPGPSGERLVVGGSFASAGSVPAKFVAAFDPATGSWSPLGSGVNSFVHAFAVLPNHELVVAGEFSLAGGMLAHRIARWNGTNWAPLGAAPTIGPVTALAVLSNGDLIAGGTSGIARWNGTQWAFMNVGLPPSFATYALAVLPGGDVIAGGAGPAPFDGLARWNGASWSPLAGGGVGGAGGPIGGRVDTLAVLQSGDVIAGGNFLFAGGVVVNNVARWNGSSWSALGSGTSSSPSSTLAPEVREACELANGDLVVGGWFDAAGGVPAARIARWDGSSWAPLGAGVRGSVENLPSGAVYALTRLGSSELVVGGYFSAAGNAGARNIARWDGAQWSALSSGPGIEDVAALAVEPNGDLTAVGGFEAAGSLVVRGVARWNGAAWSALGGGGTGGGFARAIVRLPIGGLAIGGNFTSVAGVAANAVAQWTGTQWVAMGGMLSGSDVRALAVAPDGTLCAAGVILLPGGASAGVVTWNGAAWSPLGSGLGGVVHSLAVRPNGRILAGGDFAGRVAEWDGAVWTPLDPPLSQAVEDLAVLPGGDVVAAAAFSYVFLWNGASWSSHDSGFPQISALHVLPNGDLLLGSPYSSGVHGTAAIVRWNGSTWSAVAGGLNGRVRAFATDPAGGIWVGGAFSIAGGAPSHGLAKLSSSCAATTQVAGPGCAGDTLTATLPWTGATWRADASGLPNLAAVCAVSGFSTTSLPLAAAFPTALPGCTLHVTPDVVDLVFASNGIATFGFALPNTPVLAGTTFHHQMVPIDLGPTLAMTATNALQLTVGSF